MFVEEPGVNVRLCWTDSPNGGLLLARVCLYVLPSICLSVCLPGCLSVCCSRLLMVLHLLGLTSKEEMLQVIQRKHPSFTQVSIGKTLR